MPSATKRTEARARKRRILPYRPSGGWLEASTLMEAMTRNRPRDWIRAAEHAAPEEQWTLLCFLAGQSVAIDEDVLHAAIRRAELLLATGGDPRRPLELYGRAVTALAEDLDDPALRSQLVDGLEALRPELDGLRGATEALRLLGRDGDLAWQCYAMSLLAEHLAGEE